VHGYKLSNKLDVLIPHGVFPLPVALYFR